MPPMNYSTVAANGVKKPQETVQLIVKPKDNFNGNILELVQSEVSKQKTAKVLNIKKINSDKVLVKCINKQGSEVISNTLQNNHSDKLSISPIERNNPQIKIIDVISDMDVTQLTDDIVTRNDLSEEDFKIVYKFRQKDDKLSVIAEVSPKAYIKIMKFKSVFVGYQNCRVFDDFNDRNCKKCCGYGHSYKKCRRKNEPNDTCPRCAADHNGSTCDSTVLACINCISANRYLNKKRNTNHEATDKNNCETYKARWERHISMTNYPWRPFEPFKTLK